MLLCASSVLFFSLVRFNVPKERKITPYIDGSNKHRKQSHSNHGDEKLFIAKISSKEEKKREKKTINIVSDASRKSGK